MSSFSIAFFTQRSKSLSEVRSPCSNHSRHHQHRDDSRHKQQQQDLIHEGYARLKVDYAKTSYDSPIPTKEKDDED